VLTEEAHRTSLAIQARLEENAPNYTRWIVDQARPHVGKRLLDVGCSTGNVTRQFAARTELLIGLDANPHALAQARATWANAKPHVQLHEMFVPSDELLRFQKEGIDSITCINVIEHVAEHETALRQMAAVLQPGGRLFLLAPGHPWLYGSMDAADHHHRRYTKEGIAALVEQAGLRVKLVRAMNAIGALGWFVNGRIIRRGLIPSTQAGLYDKIIPAVERLERIVQPPFGQSVIVVGEK
jgi:SAM-dependent methyltransferase